MQKGALLIVCLTLALLTSVTAQNDAAARLKYEESEEAYSNGNYKDALDKLAEVDKLLGGKSNPKTLYLRIMSANKLLGDNPFSDIPLLSALKKDLAQYLKAYASQSSLQDKVQNVNKINEEMKEYSDNADTHAGYKALSGKDTSGALTLFTKAAGDGDFEAITQLGIAAWQGYGSRSRDYTKALEWFMRGVEKGSATAMWNLGSMYIYGEEKVRDTVKGSEWHIKAAKTGNNFFMLQMGYCYLKGTGVPSDPDKAIYWLTAAANNGYRYARDRLRYIYKYGDYGIPKNPVKELEWIIKAAEAGEANAMYEAGESHMNATPPDYAKAMEWFRKGAEKGDQFALFNLGWMYYQGFGVAIDYSKAVEWFTKSAEKGYAGAMEMISKIYKKGGYGITKDDQASAQWLEKSKTAGK